MSQQLVCGDYHNFARKGQNKHGCNYPISYPHWVLEEQVIGVIRFMLDRQDPAIEILDNDPGLATLLETLLKEKKGLKDLLDLQKQTDGLPKHTIRDQIDKIKKLEAVIGERAMTANRLQAVLDLWQRSRKETDNDEAKGMRTKLHDDLRDLMDIKLYGTENFVRRWQVSRVAEICWKPIDGKRLMFRWVTRHLNSIDPVLFDGLFVVDADTGEIIMPLEDGDDLDLSILYEVADSFRGHPSRHLRLNPRGDMTFQVIARVPNRLHDIGIGTYRAFNTDVVDDGTEECQLRALEQGRPHLERWEEEIREAEYAFDHPDSPEAAEWERQQEEHRLPTKKTPGKPRWTPEVCAAVLAEKFRLDQEDPGRWYDASHREKLRVFIFEQFGVEVDLREVGYLLKKVRPTGDLPMPQLPMRSSTTTRRTKRRWPANFYTALLAEKQRLDHEDPASWYATRHQERLREFIGREFGVEVNLKVVSGVLTRLTRSPPQ